MWGREAERSAGCAVGRSRPAGAGFEDSGRGPKPKGAGGLWRLEKARMRVLCSRLREGTHLLAPLPSAPRDCTQKTVPSCGGRPPSLCSFVTAANGSQHVGAPEESPLLGRWRGFHGESSQSDTQRSETLARMVYRRWHQSTYPEGHPQGSVKRRGEPGRPQGCTRKPPGSRSGAWRRERTESGGVGGVAGTRGASPPWVLDSGPAERGHPAWRPPATGGSGTVWSDSGWAAGVRCARGFKHSGHKKGRL